MNKNNEIKRNGSGYVDPTAYEAIKNTMRNNDMDFAHQLNYIMRIENLSPREVANMCGTTEEMINKLISRERSPSFRDAQRMLDCLGYNIDIYKDGDIEHFDIEMKDSDRFFKLLNAIFDICKVAGFHVEERIILKDMKTGKIWR